MTYKPLNYSSRLYKSTQECLGIDTKLCIQTFGCFTQPRLMNWHSCILDFFVSQLSECTHWNAVKASNHLNSFSMDLLRMDIHRFLNEFIVIVFVNVVSIKFRTCFFSLISSWSPPISRDRIKKVILNMLIYMRRR